MNTRPLLTAKRIVAVAALALLPLAHTFAGGEYILLSAYSGPPGGHVNVQGFGFQAGETAHVAFQGLTADATVDADGKFTTPDFTVPQRPGGSYNIQATSPSGKSAMAPFYIEASFPSVTPLDWWVTPGQSTGFDAQNFAPGETINIQDPSSAVLGTATAGTDGNVHAPGSFHAPFNAAGHTVTITIVGQTSGASASYPLQVGGYYPSAVPSAYYATAGDTIGVSGNGFAPSETLDLFNGTTKVTTFTTDAKGDFSAPDTIHIGFGSTGKKTYHVTGETSGASSGDFSIDIGGLFPHASPSTYYATPGQTVGVSGGGFAGGETLDLMQGTTKVSTFTAGAKGDFTAAAALHIGFGSTGSKAYHVAGETSGASSGEFSVEVGGIFPQAVPTAYFALPGDTIGVTASGFAPQETVRLFDAKDVEIAHADSDADGAVAGLATSIKIPFGATGNQTYRLAGDLSGASTTFGFSVGGFDPQIDPSLWFMPPRKAFTLIGRGYAPGETVNILLNDVVATHATADVQGNFTVSTRAPSSGKSFTVTALGTQSNGTATRTLGIDVGCIVDDTP